MKKIFFAFFLFFLSFSCVFSHLQPDIVTREDWEANQEYIFYHSSTWKNIRKNEQQVAKNKKPATAEQIQKWKKKSQQLKEADRYIMQNFWEENSLSSTLYFYDKKKLYWPIQISKKIKAIVIHHTHDDYDDEIKGIQSIYKYHALNRKWGDIGYNYIIWHTGAIFEGRLGGEKSVWAHVKWNNRQTIGISVMWNYQDTPLNPEQYTALKNLILYLVEKYEIDMTKKIAFHRLCLQWPCPNYLETLYYYPLIGHRDAGHTQCPGDALYRDMQKIRREIQYERLQLNPEAKKYFRFFEKIPDWKLQKVQSFLQNQQKQGKNYEKILLYIDAYQGKK